MGTRIEAFFECVFTLPGRLYTVFSHVILLHSVYPIFEAHRVFTLNTIT